MKRVGAVTALLTLLAACGDKVNNTLLVVNVTLASLVAGQDVDRVDIDATPTHGSAAHRQFTLNTSTPLPVTLGLVPVGGPELEVAVNATAWKGDVLIVSQEATVNLVPNEAKQLSMVLDRVCATRTCSSGNTCRAASCVPSTIFASELQPYPNSGVDAGAGKDGGATPDGSTEPDASPDVALPQPTEGTWSRVDLGPTAATLNCTSLTVIGGTDLIIVGYKAAQGIALRSDASTFSPVTLPRARRPFTACGPAAQTTCGR